jgi:hypothetical protein
MSANKRTRNESHLDAIREFAVCSGLAPKIFLIGAVQGSGLGEGWYKLRKLEVEDVVVLERIEKHTDPNEDDIIRSSCFDRDKVPTNWDIQETIDDDWEEPMDGVSQPICPLNLYFEEDAIICNRDMCDWNPEFRQCSEACTNR